MSMKVFISHAHKDDAAARELVEKLKVRGVETWFDKNELQPGESWEQQIKDALIESETVVLVLGEGDPSPNVLVEAGMAYGQGKRVLPVLVGDTANLSMFANVQQVAAVGPNGIDNAAEQIVQVLNDKGAVL